MRLEELPFIPDRFDMLRRSYQGNLSGVIYPVEETLNYLNNVFANMYASRRGDFLIFRGEPGSGKSTFIHTLPIFFTGSEVFSIPDDENIAQYLRTMPPPKPLAGS